jgi:hypothetical protein
MSSLLNDKEQQLDICNFLDTSRHVIFKLLLEFDHE